MNITDKERELIDTQEFHEHCMDYRGATPQSAHNHYQLMLNYVEKLLRSQLSSQWISVNDRLPKDNEMCGDRVSALDEFGYAVIGIMLGDKLYSNSGKVTHWMPLPSPPKD